MPKPLIELPSNIHSPLYIQVNRNGFQESLHEVDVAVCDVDGMAIWSAEYAKSVIFPRSAMKPLQSIALIEYLDTSDNVPELSDAEIALICSSHNGEPLHMETVTSLLGQFDISTDELICGAHWSMQ